MCVMNGGILIQNCYGHAMYGTHGITEGTKEVQITSTHHQMQYPFNLKDTDYDLLYWSSVALSGEYEGDGVAPIRREPEVVYYHVEGKPKSLAIQGHPEMMRKKSPVIEILNDLIVKCLTDVRQKTF